VLACTFSLYTAGAGAVDISSVSGVAGSVLLFDLLSSVILSNPNISSSASIVSGFCHAVLSIYGFYHNHLLLMFILVYGLMPQLFASDVHSCPWSNTTIIHVFLTVSTIFVRSTV